MALETTLRKKVFGYREGPERRSNRPQTRFYFSNFDPIDFAELRGTRPYKLATRESLTLEKYYRRENNRLRFAQPGHAPHACIRLLTHTLGAFQIESFG